jgi:hypothetical protein
LLRSAIQQLPAVNLKSESTRRLWIPAPGATDQPLLYTAIEDAIARGPDGFDEFRAEPERGAWWGCLHAEGETWFVKAREIQSLRRRLTSVLRDQGLREEWNNSLWFQDQGVPSVQLIALGEFRTRRMLDLSLLVCRWLDRSQTLASFAELQAYSDRPATIVLAGKLFGDIIAAGAIHKQFHPWNLLVVEPEEGGAQLTPIDLQHLWIPQSLTDEDYLWALEQVSFWLHDPLINWSDKAQGTLFYDSAFAACRHRFQQPDRVSSWIRRCIARGRTAQKLHRKEWRIPAGC